MKDNLFQNSIKAIGMNALVSSIALILIGVIFVISPVSSMATISRAIGIILMIAGIMEIVVAIRSTGRPISLLTAGSLLLVLVGLWVFLHPSFILSSINLVLGVIIVVSAVSSLGQAAHHHVVQKRKGAAYEPLKRHRDGYPGNFSVKSFP